MKSRDLPRRALRLRGSALKSIGWARGLACLAVVTVMALPAAFSQSQVGNGLPYPPPAPGYPPVSPTANPTADANRIMLDSMKREDSFKELELLNTQRQKEMASDATRLIELALELKSDTDSATPDAISMFEIQKAELIEKLAHRIQSKMKESDAHTCAAHPGEPVSGCQ